MSKQRKKCLVVKDAATPSTTANALAPTAAKLLAATAAQATAKQQADNSNSKSSSPFAILDLFMVKNKW